MIWYFIIILFLLLITWLMFGPVIMKVNTDLELYRLSLPGIISLRLIPENLRLRIRLFFIPFTIDPVRLAGKGKRKKGKGKRKKGKGKREKGKGKGWLVDRNSFNKIQRALKIKNLDLDLDTDDFILNAWLIPVFSAANTNENVQMKINFEGNLFLDLDARTRISKLIRILF